MKISRKSDYALRAIVHIATHVEKDRCSINTIAESERIPRDFLAKILKELAHTEILKSYQGVHGGYQLARSAAKISVLDVIEAMDGPLGLNLCVQGEHGCDCEEKDKCPMYPFWVKAQKQVRSLLKNQTMAKFTKRKK